MHPRAVAFFMADFAQVGVTPGQEPDERPVGKDDILGSHRQE